MLRDCRIEFIIAAISSGVLPLENSSPKSRSVMEMCFHCPCHLLERMLVLIADFKGIKESICTRIGSGSSLILSRVFSIAFLTLVLLITLLLGWFFKFHSFMFFKSAHEDDFIVIYYKYLVLQRERYMFYIQAFRKYISLNQTSPSTNEISKIKTVFWGPFFSQTFLRPSQQRRGC